MRDARGRDLVRLLRSRAGYPEAATGAVVVANKIFWALGYWQVENHLITVPARAARQLGDKATFRPPSGDAPADAARAISTRSARARIAAPTARYRAVAGRAVPGKVARRLPLSRHAARRSERRRAARAPARAARAEGVRRLDQPRRHEGRQHARHADRRRTAAASCATTCRTSARRSAPARSAPRDYDEGYELPYEGDPLLEAAGLLSASPQPVADGAVPTKRRRSAASRARSFDPAAWKPRVPTAAFLRRARRRQVLGGAPRDGVFGRDDPRDREDRRVQRPARRSRSSPRC